jgi:hypothetical protein
MTQRRRFALNSNPWSASLRSCSASLTRWSQPSTASCLRRDRSEWLTFRKTSPAPAIFSPNSQQVVRNWDLLADFNAMELANKTPCDPLGIMQFNSNKMMLRYCKHKNSFRNSLTASPRTVRRPAEARKLSSVVNIELWKPTLILIKVPDKKI